MNICKQCVTPTTNPKFCSSSCSAKFNNKNVRRHGSEPNLICKCGRPKGRVSKNCTLCYANERREGLLKRPIQSLFLPGQAQRFQYNKIRTWAKKFMIEWNRPKVCEACGYDKHVEVCHKRSIADYPGMTALGEVNSKENLVYLCCNCHWEYDDTEYHQQLIDKLNNKKSLQRPGYGTCWEAPSSGKGRDFHVALGDVVEMSDSAR